MNFKTTLVLLFLLAGVGAYVFLTSRAGDGDAGRAAKPAESQQKVLAIAQSDVEHVTVESQGGDHFTLQRGDGGAWRLTAPVNAPADTFAVDSLVREVTDLTSRNRVPLDPAAQGLARPAYTVTLKDTSGKTATLAVGARSAVGDALYVKLDGESRAQVVAGSLLDQLEKPAMSYRQAKLVEATQDQIEALTVARAGEPAMRVERAGFADWKMTEPVAMPAEPSEVTGLLIGVTGLSAAEFVAEDAAAKAARYGLDKPVLTLTVRQKAPPATMPATVASASQPAATQPAPVVIKFGQYVDLLKKDVYAAVEGGPVVKLPASTLDTFKKLPLELRDRKVVNIDPESVERVTITRDLKAATQPAKRDASTSTVVIARRAETLAAAGPPAPAPAKKPDDVKQSGSVKAPDGAKKPDDAKPADPAGTKSDASTAVEGDAVLAAAEEKASAAPATPTVAAAAAPPATAAATAATSPAATSTAPATTRASTQPATAPPVPPPSKWVLESEPKGDAADGRVQSLLDALHPLRAQKYLAAAPKVEKSAGSYVLKVEAGPAGGKARTMHEIHLTDPGSPAAAIGRYGDVTFEVERSLLDKIEGDFKKGAAAPEPPAGLPNFGGPGGGGPPGGFGLPPE
jgi:hypothetical protein